MKKMIGLIAIISFILAGCSGNIINKNKDDYQNKEVLVKNIYKAEMNNDVINGNKKFAFEIFKEINKKDSKNNIFISPYSITTALSMVYNGARENTKEKMAETLHYQSIKDEDFNKGQKYLKEALYSLDEKVNIDISNSIWIREGEDIKQEFIDVNTEVFDAYVKNLDFSKEESVDIMNKWVKDSTKGLIKKIINTPIDEDVMMYLINTIYFKGEWTKGFNKKRTSKLTFNSNDKNQMKIDMMYMKEDIEFINNDDYKAIKLYYGDEKVAMYCILPEENKNINEFIDEMTNEKWNHLRKQIKKQSDLLVRLPKFKIEYGVRNINEELKAMGMEIAFGSEADFSGINEYLYISNVLHKAVIEVNEKGTEAAAVTSVEMTKECSRENAPEFIANRPFIFIIADEEDGAILFMGKVANLK